MENSSTADWLELLTMAGTSADNFDPAAVNQKPMILESAAAVLWRRCNQTLSVRSPGLVIVGLSADDWPLAVTLALQAQAAKLVLLFWNKLVGSQVVLPICGQIEKGDIVLLVSAKFTDSKTKMGVEFIKRNGGVLIALACLLGSSNLKVFYDQEYCSFGIGLTYPIISILDAPAATATV